MLATIRDSDRHWLEYEEDFSNCRRESTVDAGNNHHIASRNFELQSKENRSTRTFLLIFIFLLRNILLQTY